MKHKFLTAIVAATFIIGSFAFVSYKTNYMTDEFWKQLGWTEKDVKTSISQSFYNASTPDFLVWRKIGAGNRATIITAAGNYTKQYVNTPAFQKEYKQWREQELKKNTPVPAITKEQITKKKIEEAEAGIKKLQDIFKNTTDPNAKKAGEQSLDYQTKQLAEYKSGKSAEINRMVEDEKIRYQEAKKYYDEWVKDHPESLIELIKQRLNEFLVITKGIDYNAVYVGEWGTGYFKNPSLEHKFGKWKYAFIAGKEVTETARTFIQQWLKELN
jgi:hypothetical protein